jgi:serine/threonine-protein kinase
VGAWRIVDLSGRGAYGTVYLAEGVPPGATGQAALKLALAPRDERFERERVLLSRLRHRCIPRLLDSGNWQSPGGPPYPYLVMEWVEGLPLYDWARPTSRQVLGLLADLARALEATHALGAVHRDVKGGNALVRLSDGQGFLVDFGSGHYPGASTLTWQPLPPGTSAYRSPEALRFASHGPSAPARSYAPGPADDLFALGVTAYRLVTGEYPPMAEPEGEGAHVWAEEGPGPQPADELNARCGPELSALISRMLSLRPEARGSASELAEALEQAARLAGPTADEPLFPRKASSPPDEEAVPWPTLWRASLPAEAKATPRHPQPPAPHASGWSWLAAGAMMLGAAWMLSTPGREKAAQTRSAEQVEPSDEGTVALGDSAPAAPVASSRVTSALSPIALDLPSKPFLRQIRTDAQGRCPRKRQVAINGGCWWTLEGTAEDCREDNYVYKGKCYEPAYPPRPPATSAPVESPDGGQ